MTPDRKHLWYTQLAIGRFGSFNIETRKFEDSVVLPMNSGPRRLAISDQGILYVPLYGRGQLIEYDTRARRQIGDLRPARPGQRTLRRHLGSSAQGGVDTDFQCRCHLPFQPADKSFAVLPMPRTGAMMRMVDVDPETGHLITSYANIVEQVHGPRMALIIDPGDDAYAKVHVETHPQCAHCHRHLQLRLQWQPRLPATANRPEPAVRRWCNRAVATPATS